MTDSSIYLTRGGMVDEFYGSLRVAGATDVQWTSVAENVSSYAFYFRVTGANINPSTNNARWNGFTVRAMMKLL